MHDEPQLHSHGVGPASLRVVDHKVTDDAGRPIIWDVAVVTVVGNEDGAHKVNADLQQTMHTVDYKDLNSVPEKLAATTAGAARNAAHLARSLSTAPYPAG